MVHDIRCNTIWYRVHTAVWISKNPNLDFSKNSWFKQSWTFQETVLSKKLVVNGSDLNLSDLLMVFSKRLCENYVTFLVDKPPLHNYKKGVLGVNARRECYDKFYTIGKDL